MLSCATSWSAQLRLRFWRLFSETFKCWVWLALRCAFSRKEIWSATCLYSSSTLNLCGSELLSTGKEDMSVRRNGGTEWNRERSGVDRLLCQESCVVGYGIERWRIWPGTFLQFSRCGTVVPAQPTTAALEQMSTRFHPEQ
ncbi:uncharacterized protein EKO05_0003156 [Ascochyta rabiei]|uniref:uncharacterized protein n=1 Tax=Didymella rabiei TaxID=5454 RepID=UPI0021FE5B84|nr:uncharacterized protein EKO05_0003156 [Ascochyta rabiei]UPX12615.1 hypothetical protein EKO05_0003156 [Ascochyta rabiei]